MSLHVVDTDTGEVVDSAPAVRAPGPMTVVDVAADEGTAASKDYAARLDAVKGARALAVLLDDHRCPTVLDLGRLQAAS